MDRNGIISMIIITVLLAGMFTWGVRGAMEPYLDATTATTPTIPPPTTGATPQACTALSSTQRGSCKVGTIDIVGDTNVIRGKTYIDGDAGVQGRMFFGDSSLSAAPNAANRTDPYYLEKKWDGRQSSLRLTLNDDPDESLQIWGGSCATGNCGGAGSQQHRLGVDGVAWHRSGVQAPGNACVELGAGVGGKQRDAGKLCYQRFSQGLDVVGAGMPGAPRTVTVYDNLDVRNIALHRAGSQTPGNACVELGAGVSGKQRDAGKICYQRWGVGGVQGLDIVGAGNTGYNRVVNVYDKLNVKDQLCVGGVCVTGAQLKKLTM